MSRKLKLQGIIEAFIAAFGGTLRLREIKLRLLIQQGSMSGAGVSISELARESGTPLESVRRQLKRLRKDGLLRSVPDAKDGRVTRYFVTDLTADEWRLETLVRSLESILGPCSDRAGSGRTIAQLLALIDVLIDGYMGSIRIRGARMALLVYRATLCGNGTPISELAKAAAAPLETVRRVLAAHVGMGHIRFVEDPVDDRKTLVVTADLDAEDRRVSEMSRRLDAIARAWHRGGATGLPP